jgi:hypothetical protein
VVRTPAENLMQRILTRRGRAVMTPEEQEQRDERRGLVEQLRQGVISRQDLRLEVAGEMTAKQVQEMAHRSHEDPRLTQFKQLKPDEAERVWALATPEERELWARAYRGKDRQFQHQQRLLNR